MSLRIHFISNVRQGKNIGSRNQALGLAEVLQKLHPTAEIYEYDLHDLATLHQSLLKPSGNQILITVGNDGVTALQAMPKNRQHISLLLGHEVPRGIEAIKDAVDILALPEHITDYQEIRGIKCVRTHGVSHAMTKEKVADALTKWRDKFPGNRWPPAVIVMLGGTVDGVNYDPREAYLLGRYTVKKAKGIGAMILATSSPRAEKPAIEMLTDALAQRDCPAAFFPYGGLDESPFQAMIGLVAENPKSRIIVSGDSVSMPCEAANIVAPAQLIICSMSNENEQNRNFVEWMHREGRAKIIESSPESHKILVRPLVENPSPTALDAARQIAAAVYTFTNAPAPSPRPR